MKKERLNSLQEVSRLKQEKVRLAEHGVTSSFSVPKEVGALMLAMPSKLLEKSGLSVAPVEKGQVRVVLGPDCEKHWQSIADWREMGEKRKQRLMRNGYDFLFLVAQASVNPEVDLKRIIQTKQKKIESLEKSVPGVKQLKEYVEEGGLIQNLISEDRVKMGEQLHILFESLDPWIQQDLISKGKHPENVFQYPNN